MMMIMIMMIWNEKNVLMMKMMKIQNDENAMMLMKNDKNMMTRIKMIRI